MHYNLGFACFLTEAVFVLTFFFSLPQDSPGLSCGFSLPADESFAYKKDFLFVEKGIREITRQKELYRDYPFRQKMDELQNALRHGGLIPVGEFQHPAGDGFYPVNIQ